MQRAKAARPLSPRPADHAAPFAACTRRGCVMRSCRVTAAAAAGHARRARRHRRDLVVSR